jgi:hypothetical protein
MRKRYLFLVIVLAGCQKVVHLNLGTTAPQLVIDGEVDDRGGPYTVKLSQSIDFYAIDSFPPVSGATVLITDQASPANPDTLTETSPGTYTTHTLQGISGHTYSLYVLSSGHAYTAQSTMPPAVVLTDITFKTTSFGKHTDIQPIPNFQDPPGVPNYYQFVVYTNNVQIQKTFVFDDEFSDGRAIHEPLQTDTTDLKPFDQVRIDMYCIDQPVYNYFFQLNQVTDPGAQSQNASPANPDTNIKGGALGIFSAHTVSSQGAVVPDN